MLNFQDEYEGMLEFAMDYFRGETFRIIPEMGYETYVSDKRRFHVAERQHPDLLWVDVRYGLLGTVEPHKATLDKLEQLTDYLDMFEVLDQEGHITFVKHKDYIGVEVHD